MKYSNKSQEQFVTHKPINPNAVREGDHIEAHFPNGEIERGVAVREGKQGYRSKQRMMLCENGAKRGHIITGCAGFPDGTRFYRVTVDAVDAVDTVDAVDAVDTVSTVSTVDVVDTVDAVDQ